MQITRWKVRFAAFWGAQASSLFGSSLAQFALVWWLTQTTHSATTLAIATMVAVVPGIILGPFAGVLVDRLDRRTLIALADSVSALIALGLALLYWTDMIQVWHIFVAIFVRSLAGAFQFPAVQASTSLMVPQDQLARVNGLNQMLQGLMQIAAPPFAALLLAWMPIEAIMSIDVVTALVAVALIQGIAIPRPVAESEAGVASVMRDLRAGLAYIWRWPALLGILIISAILNLLLTPAFSLMPILVTGHFAGGATQLAWMEMAFGIGIVVGGTLLSIWGGYKRHIVTAVVGLIGMGVGVLIVGIAPATLFPMAIAGLFLAGTMNAWTNGPMMSILQSVVAPTMQGRVFTVTSSISMAMSPLGLLISGPLADRLGVQVWYVAGGIACIGMSILILMMPALMHIEDRDRQPQPTLLPAVSK